MSQDNKGYAESTISVFITNSLSDTLKHHSWHSLFINRWINKLTCVMDTAWPASIYIHETIFVISTPCTIIQYDCSNQPTGKAIGIWLPLIAPPQLGNPHLSSKLAIRSCNPSPTEIFMYLFINTLTIAVQMSFTMQQTDDLDTPNKWPSILYSVPVERNQIVIDSHNWTEIAGQSCASCLSIWGRNSSQRYINVSFLIWKFSYQSFSSNVWFTMYSQNDELLGLTHTDLSIWSCEVIAADNSRKKSLVYVFVAMTDKIFCSKFFNEQDCYFF